MALARYEGTAVDTAGNVIPNATVEVRLDQPGRPVVPLWGDRDGTVPLGNPILTDAQGGFAFHVRGGAYYIRIFTGPSQQPTFQKIVRYQAIGTAAERDVEDLAAALEAGTATFPTLSELQAFIPSQEGIGGKVTTGPDAGFYHYEFGAEEWVFDRYLYDTFARMNATGGTDNAIVAEIVPGIPEASVVMLWIEAPGTNTGPVTINGKPVVTSDEGDIPAGQWVEGRTYWFSDEGDFFKLRTDSDVSDLVAQAQEAANTAVEKAGQAVEAAEQAAELAAGLNLPPIQPGDAKKQLYVTDDETGYRLDKPARGGGELFKTVADLIADDNEVVGYEGSGAELEIAPGDIVPAQGFRYEAAASDATDYDVATAGGVKLNLVPAHGVSLAALGATGDGSDETDIVQKFANRMAGYMAMGEPGKEYTVRSVRWPSNTSLFFAKFKTLAGSENLRSPVTVDGTTATGGGPKADVLFYSVHVDGNRQNQTGIVVPTSEDGGRHGFRIIGRVSNITLENCSAIYCATDGLAIYSRFMQNSADDADFCFHNIRTINCRFDWNRRWGFAADSVDTALHDGGSCSNNGLDLNTTDPLSHGNRGARTVPDGTYPNGRLYGGGWDYEDYGIGMGFRNILVRDIECLGNYGLPGFMTHVAQDNPLMVPRTNLRVLGGKYSKPLMAIDAGTDIDRPTFQVAAGGAVDGGNYLYTDMHIDIQAETWLLLTGANNVRVDGRYGRLNGNSYRVLCRSCGPRVSFGNMFERGAVDLRPGPAIAGVAVSNVSGITVTREIADSGPVNRYRVVVAFTATAAGLVRFNLTVGNGFAVSSVVGQVRQNSNGNGLALAAQVASSTQINVGVTAVASGAHTAELEVSLS